MTIVYIYDELARLTAVVDPDADTATYGYDSVGNLLSIERWPSSVLSIIGFTPKRGPVGALVTIYGTGFSATASQNIVNFSGIPATVVSGSTTQIVTAVPSGAATGLITVTTPAGSATSSTPFTVTPASGAPTIIGFSPTIGTPGTAVLLTGTNFDITLSNNKVLFNRTYGLVSSATPTTLETSVPRGTGSGRISITTPSGNVVSSGDFFIPPSPYTAADLDFTERMAIGESKLVTINAANKIGLVVFDGTAGQRVSANLSRVTISFGALSVLNPDGTPLVLSIPIGTPNQFIEPKKLPVTGTYTAVVDPTDVHTGSLTLTLFDVPPDPINTIAIGGPLAIVSTTAPGQNARLTFAGVAGQRVNVGIRDVSFGPGGLGMQVSILKPDGTQLASTIVTTSGGHIATNSLPDTGTYTVVVDPQDATTANLSLTLAEVNP